MCYFLKRKKEEDLCIIFVSRFVGSLFYNCKLNYGDNIYKISFFFLKKKLRNPRNTDDIPLFPFKSI